MNNNIRLKELRGFRICFRELFFVKGSVCNVEIGVSEKINNSFFKLRTLKKIAHL